MRQDMAKVIVERPRVGGHNNRKATRRWQRTELEDLPSKESMRRRHVDRKSLNENLRPLLRFLLKNVGRPWDKVYSEICEGIKITNTVQRHVRQHVDMDVIQPGLVHAEGKKLFHTRYGFRVELKDNNTFYVHPKTGLLCYSGPYKKFRLFTPKPIIVLDKWHHLHKFGDHWFVVTLAPFPERRVKENGLSSYWYVRDVVIDDYLENLAVPAPGAPLWRQNDRRLEMTYGRTGVYGASARQANKKELKVIPKGQR